MSGGRPPYSSVFFAPNVYSTFSFPPREQVCRFINKDGRSRRRAASANAAQLTVSLLSRCVFPPAEWRVMDVGLRRGNVVVAVLSRGTVVGCRAVSRSRDTFTHVALVPVPLYRRGTRLEHPLRRTGGHRRDVRPTTNRSAECVLFVSILRGHRDAGMDGRPGKGGLSFPASADEKWRPTRRRKGARSS